MSKQLSRNIVIEWLSKHPVILQVGIWLVVAAALITGVVLWALGILTEWESLGLPGVFILNLVGSATIFLPLPGIAAICAGAVPQVIPEGSNVAWHLFLVIMFGSVGSTIGEMTSYLAGYGLIHTKTGKSIKTKNKTYEKVSRFMDKSGWLTLLVLGILPNPLFDSAGIVAGSTGYRLSSFIFWVFCGKLIKYSYTAVGCHYAVGWIMRIVGNVN